MPSGGSRGDQGRQSRDRSTHTNGSGAGGLHGVRGAADNMQAVAVGGAVGGERRPVPVQGRVDFSDDSDSCIGRGRRGTADRDAVAAGQGRSVGGEGGGKPVV